MQSTTSWSRNISQVTDTWSSGGVIKHCHDNLSDYDMISMIWFIFISVSGIIGNSIAIRVLTTSASIRRNTSCSLMVSQSCVDLFSCCAIIGELATSSVLKGRQFDDESRWDYVLCILWVSDFPFMTGVLISSYNLAAVSVDRALSVSLPVFHRRRFSDPMAQRRMAYSAWALGLLFKLALMLPTTGIQDGHCRDWELFPDQGHRKAFGLGLLVLTYLLPVLIIAVSYYSIYVSLKQRKINSEMANRQVVKRNVLRTLVIVVVCYIICHTLKASLHTAFTFGIDIDLNGRLYRIGIILMLANACVNPVIYTFQYKDYQVELKDMMSRMLTSCKRHGNQVASENSLSNSKCNAISTKCSHKASNNSRAKDNSKNTKTKTTISE